VQTQSPLSSPFIGYFEIQIIDLRESGVAAIGVAANGFPNNKQPGWITGSYGYHSDDGQKFHNIGSGTPYGPTYTRNDVVGCGFNFKTNELFFTKNGKHLGVAFSGLPRSSLYPTIGLDHATVLVNFGETRPFMYNMDSLIETEHARMKQEIASKQLNNDLIHELVRNYLIHEGYAETLSHLDSTQQSDLHSRELKNHKPKHPLAQDGINFEELKFRRELQLMIKQQDASIVIAALQEKYPEFLKQSKEANCLLWILAFIDAVKLNDCVTAIQIAQSHLYSLTLLNESVDNSSKPQLPPISVSSLFFV